MSSFKERLSGSKDRMTFHVCTIPSAAVTQALAAAGADSVIVDLEHGAVDYGSGHAMIAATAGHDCAPLVRVARTDPTDVKRALDIGAEGIVFPLIRTAEDARLAVASLRYPPDGVRGFGPFLAQSRWGTELMDHRDRMQERLICCLLAETRDAVENIEEICAVPGIDLVVPAPFDLSTDLGVSGQFDHPDFTAALHRIETACHAAGLPLGGVSLVPEQAEALLSRGYRVIGGFDAIWLRNAAKELKRWAG